MPMLTDAQASQFASLALDCVHRELPHKLDHMIAHDRDVAAPRVLHPAFYGCLDWHSAVHAHWLLARIARTRPQLPEVPRIRAALDRSLTAANLRAEADYFTPDRQSFERTYGWAWLLALAAELAQWAEPWATNLAPLTQTIVARYHAFLPKQRYPIRTGVHANTAFGLALALDYARAVGDTALAALLTERATTYFGADTDAPAAWEPGGEDFLSPVLVEADLMRRVLAPAAFARWLDAFLPRGLPPQLAEPVSVADRADPKLAHLDGLNLSRAWCLHAIAAALPAGALRTQLAAAAEAHTREGLAHVATGDYMGEHWLATFAVYLAG